MTDTILKRVEDDGTLVGFQLCTQGRVVAEATREAPGLPWTVEMKGMLLGTVWPNGTQSLQEELVKAMLNAIKEE